MRRVLKANETVRASLFEAYIAGVYYSLLGPDMVRSQSSQAASEAGETITSDDSSSAVDTPKDDTDASASESSDTADDCDEDQVQKVEATSEKNDEDDPESETQHVDQATSESSASSSDEAQILETPTNDGEVETDASTASTPESGSSQDPAIPRSSEGSDTIKPGKTRGEAFDYLFAWLSQIFEPLTHYVVDILRAEELRLQALPRTPYANFDLPEEWADEDRKAVGGKATLHQCKVITPGGIPLYTCERVDLASVSGAWKVVCVAKDSEGKEWYVFCKFGMFAYRC